MSRPFPFPSVKKESRSFDLFIANLLTSAVDLHRVVGDFQLVGVPSSASAAGKPGMFAKDDSYIYVCVGDNTWKRVAISTW